MSSVEFAKGFCTVYTYQSLEDVKKNNAGIVEKPDVITSYVFNVLAYLPIISMIIAIGRLVVASILTHRSQDKMIKALPILVDWLGKNGCVKAQDAKECNVILEKGVSRNDGYIAGQWVRVVMEMLNLGLLLAFIDIIFSIGTYMKKPDAAELTKKQHDSNLVDSVMNLYKLFFNKEYWINKLRQDVALIKQLEEIGIKKEDLQ